MVDSLDTNLCSVVQRWLKKITDKLCQKNNTALIKIKFGKHKTQCNFMMLTHNKEVEVKDMPRTLEEAK